MSNPSATIRNDDCFDLSVVLACYREEPHLHASVKTLYEYLAATRLRFELIFVEDASPDNTWQAIVEAREWLLGQGVGVQALRHDVNQGRGATVQDGFLVAKGDVVVYLDIDLENSLDPMLAMFLRIHNGECHGVIGKRLYQPWQSGLLRSLMSTTYKSLANRLLDLPVSDPAAGFKMFLRSAIVPVLANMENRTWFWDTEIVVRAALSGMVLKEHGLIFERNPGKISTVRVLRDSYEYFMALLRFRRSLRRESAAAGNIGKIYAQPAAVAKLDTPVRFKRQSVAISPVAARATSLSAQRLAEMSAIEKSG